MSRVVRGAQTALLVSNVREDTGGGRQAQHGRVSVLPEGRSRLGSRESNGQSVSVAGRSAVGQHHRVSQVGQLSRHH